MFFFPCQFFARALLSEHLEQASFFKPWAYTSLKGVLGGLYPRGLKIRRNFLLIGRWGYKWVGVISGVRGLQCINSSL